ncbi:MAG: sialate O-acetylesterase [Prevotella sp.]|nr:sialate O-acetylesterase [Prevotella sp.]
METKNCQNFLKKQWQTILSVTLIFNFFTFSTSIVSAAQKKANEKIRVACVGNSVTYGMGVEDREKNAYPVVLQRLLGDDYDVRNFGHSGATLLNHGHRPYTKLPEYQQALDFKADWVVIHLGLNDTDPRNWPNYGDEFIGDYRALIDSFREANPQAKVWICMMTPIFHRHPRFQTGTRDWHAAIQQRIRQIAATTDVGLIDLHTPLYAHPELLPDALHPNAKGAAILAQTVFSALTGDKGGLKPSPMYGNGMVLQRGDSIVLHGTANVGDEVLVTFNGVSQTAKSDSEGAWRVKFPSMEAGGPYRLSFSLAQKDGNRKSQKNSKNRTPSPSGEGWGGAITFDSVYVGEVWLCSGQSNMDFQLRRSSTAQEDVALFPQSAASRLLHLCDMSPLYSTDDNGWSPAVCDSVNQLRFLKKPEWKLATAENIKNFSAIAYHFGRVLADSLQVPIGIICNAVGGSTTESWIDRKTLEKSLPNILTDWYFGDYGQPWARNRALANIAQVVNVENDGKSTPDRNKTRLQRHPYEPCYLFEAGILPLDHYRIKGVAWYQGESNAHNIELHKQLFQMFRNSWTRYFGRPTISIYFVQLSSLSRPSWPAFRDSQQRLYGGMVVSHDHGDSLDVHPRNKRPIGERLAWKALKQNYDRRSIVADGPHHPMAVQSRDGILVYFARENEGLHPSSGDRLIGFEVAGKDGIFHPAEARVIEDQYVLVTCPEVDEPTELRYAWQPFTRANLVNGAGLPASTFKIKVGPKNYREKIFD